MNSGFRTIATFIFLVCGITVIVVTLVFLVKERKRAYVIQNEIQKLEQEKKRYEHDNNTLQDEVAYLQSEHSYEKEAKKLNYKKKGEHVVIVRRSPKKNEKKDKIVQKQEDAHSVEHQKVWLSYFF